MLKNGENNMINSKNRPENIPVRQWQVAPAVPMALVQALPHLNPVLLQVLYNRGITAEAEIHAFLEGQYLQPDDPFLLPDMDTAVDRIGAARQNDEKIVVYGDFDADGVTSTVLLVEALRGLEGMERRNVRPYIPDRVDEGYGLNKDALSKIREEYEASLVITVDCGIRSVGEVEHANEIGLDVIITDHHSIGPVLPPATAVVNPKRDDSSYPEQMLAGVGIAYKLAQALHTHMPSQAGFQLQNLLDLVAIGTVADIAPLLGENRRLVQEGLAVLNTLQRPGVSALAQSAGVKSGRITAETIGFILGPRINAAGRLDHAYTAAKLLASNNLLQARGMAEELDTLNRRRQAITAELSRHAESLIDDAEAQFVLFAADPEFESGVVGLVASRLKEQYYRPAIVLKREEEESHGSCRSIPEFHITRALDEVADLLERYGGHSQAAGLTIRNENIPAFVARLQAITQAQLADEPLQPTLTIDVEIGLDEVDWALHEVLQQLEPTGAANATPIFMSRGVQVQSYRAVGKDRSHLQLTLAHGEERLLQCIGFRQGAWVANMPDLVDVVYTLTVNEWKGRRSLQLNVQDIRPAAL